MLTVNIGGKLTRRVCMKNTATTSQASCIEHVSASNFSKWYFGGLPNIYCLIKSPLKCTRFTFTSQVVIQSFFFSKTNKHHFWAIFVFFVSFCFPFLHILFLFFIEFYWFHYQCFFCVCVCVFDFHFFISFLNCCIYFTRHNSIWKCIFSLIRSTFFALKS